ncbi:SRPBCC family protein [Streptomyces sp. NPDC085481]|uniref:SRPBCC family protein n=1 Tax=Streptomyces sp. NPDC085481 TaxID=3365727 RepID=UPI0037D1A044
MEHEVFVPVPAEVLRATLTDPARVARCVPGLQQDADTGAGPLAGRLRIRVGGNTITYRGVLRCTERDGAFAVEGEGSEVRGKGTAALALTLALTPVAEGTTLSFTGRVTAGGRLADADPEARGAAGARLLDRFAEALAAVADVEAEMAAESRALADAERDARREAQQDPGRDVDQDAERDDERDDEQDAEAEADSDDDGVDDGVEEPGRASVFDTPVPPPSLDPLADDTVDDELGARPPAAEAAHARRTMIGRSAEEVDHAPPRGRYAPVPAPEASGASATLRWIAPAAALAIASAVVVGRALRRRR